MKTILSKFVLTASAVLMTCAANSNVVFEDHGQFSTDSKTGLDWLDVTATAGLSYAQVLAGAGGWLSQGWRYANGNEIRSLFSQYVGTGPENMYSDNYSTAQRIIRQMGVSNSCGNSEGVNIFVATCGNQISIDAFFNDGTDNRTVGLGELLARQPGTFSQTGSRWVVYDDFWTFGPGVPSWSVGYGSFMVRTTVSSPVPEPETYALMLTGLGLIGATARRRQQKSKAV